MGSFSILKGPVEHLKSMVTMERMPFTIIYLGSMAWTLYLTCSKGGLKGYAYVMVASVIQLVALVWYLVSFLPGGTMGLRLVANVMCTFLQPIIKVVVRAQAMCIAACVKYFARGSSS